MGLHLFDLTGRRALITGLPPLRAGIKAAPDARLSLFAGDLVSGGDGQDDSEWGEWFAAAGWLPQETAVAPAIGNHEYFEEFEDTPQERRVLGRHWPVTFALPRNGVDAADTSTYWFDYQGVRIAVLDGTSALDLGTAKAQAAGRRAGGGPRGRRPLRGGRRPDRRQGKPALDLLPRRRHFPAILGRQTVRLICGRVACSPISISKSR